MRYLLIFSVCLFSIFIVDEAAIAQEAKSSPTKFYNFDDLLINGKVKKPQVLWVDARQKVKFEKLLKLKKDFMVKLKETKKDPTLR